jgi:hypothetical protein
MLTYSLWKYLIKIITEISFLHASECVMVIVVRVYVDDDSTFVGSCTFDQLDEPKEYSV